MECVAGLDMHVDIIGFLVIMILHALSHRMILQLLAFICLIFCYILKDSRCYIYKNGAEIALFSGLIYLTDWCNKLLLLILKCEFY